MTDQGYDGAIRINTKIDEGGFDNAIKNLSAKVRKLSGEIKNLSQKFEASFKSSFNNIGNTAQKEFKSIGNTVSESAKTATQSMNQSWELMNWEEKEQVLLKMGDLYSEIWKTMGPEEQREKIDEFIASLNEIPPTAEGAAEETNDSAAKIGLSFTKLLPKVSGVFGKILGLIKGISPEVYIAVAAVAALGFGIKKAFRGIKEIIQNAIGKVKEFITTIVDAVKSSVNNFVSKITQSIKYVGRIILRSLIYSLIRAARQAISSALEISELSQTVKELNETVNYLVADFINLFIPQLKSATSWLLNLLNIVRQVIAALKGQSTYTKVVVDGLDEAGEAASSAANALAAFDKIDVLQQSSGGVGVGVEKKKFLLMKNGSNSPKW